MHGSRPTCGAHPHSRGENASNFYVPFQSQGSSPLTRGKPGDRASDRLPRRLIPAHAGKTVRFRRLLARLRAHPRSRRENRLIHWPTRSLVGSSPLTRGKLHRFCSREFLERLIPTHAGKTSHSRLRRYDAGAHPRSRGENTSPAGATGISQGSSPLTRVNRSGGDFR